MANKQQGWEDNNQDGAEVPGAGGAGQWDQRDLAAQWNTEQPEAGEQGSSEYWATGQESAGQQSTEYPEAARQDQPALDQHATDQPSQATLWNPAPAQQRKRRPWLIPLALGCAVLAVAAGVGIGLTVLSQRGGTQDDAAASGATEMASEDATSQSRSSAASADRTSDAEPSARADEGETSTGSCAIPFVRQFEGMKEVNHLSYCDGIHLYGGLRGSDFTVLARWDGNAWVAIHRDGESPESSFPCYRHERLERLGFPSKVVDSITACPDDSESTRSQQAPAAGAGTAPLRVGLGEAEVAKISNPECDGRYVLIVDSIIDDEPQRAGTKIAQSIVANRGAHYTSPGQCSSLRAKFNGQAVYPIYYDYGTNRQAMCDAKRQRGGNGRTLNTRGDFTDPCDV